MWADWLKQTKRVYDARASIPFDGHTNAIEVAKCVDLIGNIEPRLNAKICDVGCGGGWHLREMARRGYSHLYGFDISPQSLILAAETCASTNAILILGDVCTVALHEFFDLITIFNATLGSGSRQCDLAFVRNAASMLTANGSLALTYLPRELAARYVGDFDVPYCQATNTAVSSSVRFNSDNGSLQISQKIGSEIIPTETLHLYSHQEMALLLSEAGLDVTCSSLKSSRLQGYSDDEYWGSLIARKSSG